MNRYDYAVCGLGMAGLSLGARLAVALPEHRRVVLLDPREGYSQDKSWCFWWHTPDRVDSAISHRWHSWRVSMPGVEVVQRSVRHPYVHVDSQRFYAEALCAMRARSGFEVRLGEAVGAIKQDGAEVLVASTSGATSRVERAFDTRPRFLDTRPLLLQHFAGWEVETERAIFDPTVVDLMDFQDADRGDVHFFYVLPFSPNRALVESTHLSTRALAAEQYDTEIAAYLDRGGAGQVNVLRREGGVIPMREYTGGLECTDGFCRLGLSSEATRASTGYCFAATQRQTQQVSQALGGGRNPCPHGVRSRFSGWLDGVFVRYLRENPAGAPDAFLRLFRATDGDAIARFMSDRATLQDYGRVIGALPSPPMLGKALKHALRI